MTETGKMLVTMDEICEYVGRNVVTIKKWIKEEKFPAIKVDGRWESNTLLIDKFRQQRIEKLCAGTVQDG